MTPEELLSMFTHPDNQDRMDKLNILVLTSIEILECLDRLTELVEKMVESRSNYGRPEERP